MATNVIHLTCYLHGNKDLIKVPVAMVTKVIITYPLLLRIWGNAPLCSQPAGTATAPRCPLPQLDANHPTGKSHHYFDTRLQMKQQTEQIFRLTKQTRNSMAQDLS